MITNNRLSPEVLIIDDSGNNVGRMRSSEAEHLATEKGLDLFEVHRQNGTSVCRMMDQGKWKYEQKKKKRENRQVNLSIKEVKFGMRIDSHDQDIKINHIKKFLSKGHDVRLVVEMRGRERVFPRNATLKMNEIVESLNGTCKVEDKTKASRSSISRLVHPVKDTNGKNKNGNDLEGSQKGNLQRAENHR